MLQREARAVRRAGRFGDTELVHLNKRELGYLHKVFGKPSKNPATGLPEFFDLGGVMSWIAPMLAPAVASAVLPGSMGEIGNVFLGEGSPWSSTLGSGLVGGLAGAAVNGFKNPFGDFAKGAGIGALTPSLGKAAGFDFQTPFNIPELFNMPDALGLASPGQGYVPGPTGTTYDSIDQLLATPGATGASPAAAATISSAGPGVAAGKGSGDFLQKLAPLAAMGALGALGSGGQQQAAPQQAAPPPKPSSWTNYQFPTQRLQRNRRDPNAPPSRPGEFVFFDDNQTPNVQSTYARGGALQTGRGAPPSEAAQRGYITGPGDGRADEIEARLSNNEYVMDAESMALLGNGSPEAGAKKMDAMRANLRKHKGKSLAKGKFSPNAKPAEGYLS